MMSAPDAWKANLQKKVEQLQHVLLNFLTTREDKDADEANRQLAGLKMMFSDSQLPPAVRVLENALTQFRNAKHQPQYLLGVMRAYEQLPSVAKFSEVESRSFDDIFESYKTDGELQSLVNELVALLEKILSEADDLLTAHIARELQIILEQLKKRDRRSLYELQSWIDLSVRALIVVAETYTGTHGLVLVYEAAKVAWRIKGVLLERYVDAQKRLIDEHKLTYVQTAVSKIPEISTNEDFERLLGAGDKRPLGQGVQKSLGAPEKPGA
jgi:hypothetical protein